MSDIIKRIEYSVFNSGTITKDYACEVLKLNHSDTIELLNLTNRIRGHFKGNEVSLCSIINAKSGLCPEDCAFCSQSIYSKTDAPIYQLVEPEKILKRAIDVRKYGAREFSIVTSGYSVNRKNEVESIKSAISMVRSHTELECCASLGNLDRFQLEEFKKTGLQRYHHNIETAESFFTKICTTHKYEENIKTIEIAKELGFWVCSGGIFGMGESLEQRVEMTFTIKELDVDSIPLNFLNPIKGTRLESTNYLTPFDCLKIIAMFRLVMPKKDIFICGGREVNLRDLQSLIFFAGANGMMIGGYLTTKGRDYRDDLEMIEDLGLNIRN